MCGRYSVGDEEKSAEMKQIIDTLSRKVGSEKIAKIKTSGEVRPTDLAPVLVGTKVTSMQWGFQQNDGKLVINARSESASLRQMFKKSFEEMRCLIPAMLYYEWWKHDGASHKCAFFSERSMIYMAGIYRFEPEAKVPRFTILTREAAPGISFVHNRMPVILDGDARREWLVGDDPAQTIRKANLNISLRMA